MKSFKLKYPLLKLFWIIVITSCDNKENKNPLADKLQPAESEFSSVNSTIIENSVKIDTVYKDFTYEDYIGFYRFGMPLSEWNKSLAELDKNNIIKNLCKLNSTENSKFVYGSYQGFYELNQNDKTIEQGTGYYVKGLFENVKYHSDTVEILRLNGSSVNEPILIGIQIDFDINLSDINATINSILANDSLEFLAGSIPLVQNKCAITKEDFPIGMPDYILEENLNSALEKYKSNNNQNYSPSNSNSIPSSRRRRESFTSNFKILYSTKNYYMTVELDKTTSAIVQRSNEMNNFEILYIEDGYCNYKLTQNFFSKLQSGLNIEDYMTSEELTRHRQSIQTKRLIDEALNK